MLYAVLGLVPVLSAAAFAVKASPSQSTVTLVISIIGCVTGVAGFVLSFYRYLADRVRLHVDFYKPHLCGFLSNTYRVIVCQYVLVLLVRLTNIGAHPTSLTEISVRHQKMKLRHYPDYQAVSIQFREDEKHMIVCLSSVKPVGLPVYLEPGKTVDTVLAFPFADPLEEKLGNGGKITLTFHGPAISKRMRVDVRTLTLESVRANLHSQGNTHR